MHIGEKVIRELPALLSAVGLSVILGIWYVFLFIAQPEGLGTFEAAGQQAVSALDPENPEAAFFIGTIVSVLLCLASAVLFLSRMPKVAVGIVAINTLAAIFLFSPVLTLVIGLPLLLVGQVWKNA